MSTLENKPLVTIIIPTFNSSGTLDQCLKSIRCQAYENIEIIIVDNFSNDDINLIANKYNTKLMYLSAERGKSKNLGVANSHGKYVCFIDSDMELTKMVISQCIYMSEQGINPDSSVITIPEKNLGSSFWTKVRDLEKIMYTDTKIESPRFFSKDLVNRAGGFDEDIVFFEESTLPLKLQQLGFDKSNRIDSYILHHEKNFSLLRHLKKKYYYGKTLPLFKAKYSQNANEQLSLPYRLNILLANYKLFYKEPYLFIGVLILKSLEIFFLLFGSTQGGKEN